MPILTRPTLTRPTPTRPARVIVWSLAGLLSAGLLGAGIASVDGAVSASPGASPTPSASSTNAPNGTTPGGAHRHGRAFDGRLLAGLGRPLHGEFTVRTGNGGYEVVVMQYGTVAEVGGSTLRVRSEDNYAASYAVSSTTVIRDNGTTVRLAALKTGDTVRVVAVKAADGTLRARAVLGGRLGGRDGTRPGRRGGAPSTPSTPAAPGGSSATSGNTTGV